MTDSVRKLTDITPAEFLAAYNDPTLDNKGVVAKLNCGNWSVIGVRLRSEANQLRTTMHRSGGMEGEHRPLTKAELRAKSDGGDAAAAWLKENAAPAAGPTAGAPAAGPSGAEAGAGEGDGYPSPAEGSTEAPAGDATSEAAPGGEVGASEPIGEFTFIAEMSGQKLRFRGRTVAEASNALMAKLREQNYSKIQITKVPSGAAVGMNEIENGGNYKISKQLTAADEAPDDRGAWIDVPKA